MVFDAAIIGGGIHGCSAALQLARKGMRCVVIERNHVGSQASGTNAGGIRRLGRHPAELPLTVASMDLWRSIEDLVGVGCGLKTPGHVFVAENEEELDLLRVREARLRSWGYDHEEVIDTDTVRNLVPGISRHIVGGIIARDDGFANPYQSVMAFRNAAQACGVVFREKTTVSGLRPDGHVWRVETSDGHETAGVIVNCAGAWGGEIAAWCGDHVPVRAEAPMMMVTAPIERFFGPVLGRVRGRLSLKQGTNGTVLVGGGQRARIDSATGRVDLNVAGLRTSAQTVSRIIPRLINAHILRAWSGVEGYVPGGIPVIGPSQSEEGIFHAFAFSGHGFQLGPIVGRILSELIVDGESTMPLTPFRVDRFDHEVEAVDIWTSSGLVAQPVKRSSETVPMPQSERQISL